MNGAKPAMRIICAMPRASLLSVLLRIAQARAHLRFAVSTDMRNRGVQAFWAMHVEAMNWSGMGIREYAAALRLSPTSLRKWRDRLDEEEVAIDWRAHLYPSARPVVSTSFLMAGCQAPGQEGQWRRHSSIGCKRPVSASPSRNDLC